jgi:hypothetical protein
VAPRIAEAFVQKMTFAYVVGGGEIPVRLDPTLVSKYAENVPLYVSLRRRAGSAMPNVRREDVQAFVLRATHPLPPYSRVLVHSGAARYRTAHLDYTLFREPGISNDLVVGDPVVVSTPLDKQELRNPRQEDLEAARKLITHLNEHLEYYHKAIWRMMDPERRFMLLDGYLAPNAGGRSVASVVENRLIGIVGNSLVMPVARGFHLDPTYKQDVEKPIDLLHHYAPTTPIPPTRISVPTRGVFAEAVMGSCNSCEEKDDTRFWRFEESPCPGEPTPIQPVSTDTRRAEPPDMTAKDLPAPIINLQNAPALPDPTGLGAALQVLGTPNLFRDITGLEGNQRNALAAFTASLDAAKSFAGEASKLAMQKALTQDMDKTLKTISQAKADGLLTEQQANALTESALRGMIGDERKPETALTDSPEVKDLLRSATTSDKADVSLARSGETLSVKREGPPPPEGQAVGPFGFASTTVSDFASTFLTFETIGASRVFVATKLRKLAFIRSLFNSTNQTGPTTREVRPFGEALTRFVMRPDPAAPENIQIPIKGILFHPTDPADPTKLPSSPAKFPLVMIVHGNHAAFVFQWGTPTSTISSGGITTIKYPTTGVTDVPNDEGYQYFQRELAKAGIVSISVNNNLANQVNSLLDLRAETMFLMFKQLQKLDSDPNWILKDRLDYKNVGLVGHSRGGDTVIHFVTKNRSRTGDDQFGIKAVCAIAPTDFTGQTGTKNELKGTDDLQFLGLWGTHDADVAGDGGAKSTTGVIYRHYDRAWCPKMMHVMRGGTHNRFNTVWNNLKDYGDPRHPHVADPLNPPIDPEIVSDSDQQEATAEYVTAFMRLALQNDASDRTLLTGERNNSPIVLTSTQWWFGSTKPKTIDSFASATKNDLGGARTGGTKVVMSDASVGSTRTDPFAPHVTDVLQVNVSSGVSSPVVVREEIPTLDKDFQTNFDTLTFRMRRWHSDVSSQTAIDAVPDPMPVMKVRLIAVDGTAELDSTAIQNVIQGAPTRPVFVEIFDSLGRVNNTKVALETYHIPLSKFTGITRTEITALEIELDPATGDHVFIDSISLVKS